MILRTHVFASDIHVYHYIIEILMSSTLFPIFRNMCGNSFDLIVLSATFSNISAISWRPVVVVEEARVPGENHRP